LFIVHGSDLFSDTAEEYLDPLYKLEEMCKVRQEVAGMVHNNYTFNDPNNSDLNLVYMYSYSGVFL
jgi:hypothetical protein